MIRLVKAAFLCVSVLTFTMLGYSCSGNSTSPMSAPADTVIVGTVHLADTTSFKKSAGGACAIYAEGTFSYPTAYIDHATLEQLQRLYASTVLEAPDTLSLADAMAQCVANSLHQYDFATPADGGVAEEIDPETDDTIVYHTTSNVQMHYNRNGLVTFCRVDVVKKDSVVTSVAHRYYTIDLKQMHAVDLRDMFTDDALPEVARLLRSRLLEQNKVQNAEQLNELGYFNVDNLVATRNFFFDKAGITWSYLPNELAVSAIGEPCITLTYDELTPLLCEGSVVAHVK